MTLGEELDLIMASIEYVLTGKVKSYEIGEDKIIRLSLGELYQARDTLVEDIKHRGRDHVLGSVSIPDEAEVSFVS